MFIFNLLKYCSALKMTYSNVSKYELHDAIFLNKIHYQICRELEKPSQPFS